MAIYEIDGVAPNIDKDAYIHPEAVIIGSVTIGAKSSVWPCAVLRGDYGHIEVGQGTSIQDGTVIHATAVDSTIVGNGCVVGHNVHLEGCTIEDDTLVGSGSIVMERAVVGPGAVVAAGAVVRAGTLVPKNALAAGVPATVRLDGASGDYVSSSAALYENNARRYTRTLRRIG